MGERCIMCGRTPKKEKLMEEKLIKTCLECGAQFKARTKRSRFCSDKCMWTWARKNPGIRKDTRISEPTASKEETKDPPLKIVEPRVAANPRNTHEGMSMKQEMLARLWKELDEIRAAIAVIERLEI